MAKISNVRKRKNSVQDWYEIKPLLKEYATRVGTTELGALRDLLTDLILYCHKNKIDFSERMRAARDVAREIEEEAEINRFNKISS